MASLGTHATRQDDLNVDGWTCVVTGGGTGVGLAIARAFADNGARVYISGGRRDTARTPTQASVSQDAHLKGEIILLLSESVTQLVELISEREESIDVLVNISDIANDRKTTKSPPNALSMTPLKESMHSLEPKDDLHDLVSLYACISLLSHGLAASHFSTTAAFMPLLSAGNTAIVINYPPSDADEGSGSALCRLGCTPSKAVSVHLTTLVALEMRRQMAGGRDLRIVTKSLPATNGDLEDSSASRTTAEDDAARAALLLACQQRSSGSHVTIGGA
ncbi:hypothetical protein EV714DRAFT_267801 [Schizophyllum commune]